MATNSPHASPRLSASAQGALEADGFVMLYESSSQENTGASRKGLKHALDSAIQHLSRERGRADREHRKVVQKAKRLQGVIAMIRSTIKATLYCPVTLELSCDWWALSPCGHEVSGIGLQLLLKYAIERELKEREDISIGSDLRTKDPQTYDERDLEKFKTQGFPWNPFRPRYLCPVCRSRVMTVPVKSRRLKDLVEGISGVLDQADGGAFEFWDAEGEHMNWESYFIFF